MKRCLKHLSQAGLAAVIVGQLSAATLAAENGVTNFPAGASGGMISGLPPVPGIFVMNQVNYSSADALYDANGKKLPILFDLSSRADTVRLLAAYPAEIFGAKVYSQLVFPVVHLETKPFGHRQAADGLANVTVTPAILSWTNGPQHFTVGLDIATSWATYDATKLSVGNGYSSVVPTIGYCSDVPNGFAFRVLARLEFNSENDATSYQSGTALIVDGMVGWNFGDWKLGLVAGYTQQLEDDKLNGVSIGNRLKQLALGPSISYRAGPYIFNVNYQPNLYAENGANVSTLWANVALPLWTPQAPMETLEGGKH
jgi:hypothetical protein